jgi:hypothetical protein
VRGREILCAPTRNRLRCTSAFFPATGVQTTGAFSMAAACGGRAPSAGDSSCPAPQLAQYVFLQALAEVVVSAEFLPATA